MAAKRKRNTDSDTAGRKYVPAQPGRKTALSAGPGLAEVSTAAAPSSGWVTASQLRANQVTPPVNDQEAGGQGVGGLPNLDLNTPDAVIRNLGYTGEMWQQVPSTRVTDQEAGQQYDTVQSPQLMQWLKQNGYEMGYDQQSNLSALLDKNGRPVAGTEFTGVDADRQFRNAGLIAGAIVGGGIAAAGSGGAGAGGAAAGAGGETAALSTGNVGALGGTSTFDGLATAGAEFGAAGAGDSALLTAGAGDGLAGAGSASLSGGTAGYGGTLSGIGSTGTIAQGAGQAGSLASVDTATAVQSTALPNTGASMVGEGMTTSNWLDLGKLALTGYAIGKQTAPDAPDMTGVNEAAKANASIADRQQTLAEQQYADQRALLEQYSPLLKAQLEKANTLQDQSIAQSAAQWEDYQNTWRPVEQQLAARTTALADPGRIEQEASRAAADTTSQYDRARQSTEASLAMAGASPEKIAALTAAGRLNEAKAVGGAQAGARRSTETNQIALLDNAARFGRNMPSTGIQTAALAGSQGQQVQGAYGTLASATGQPAASASPLLANAASANASAGSLFGNAAQQNYTANMNQYNAAMGGLLAGANLWGMYGLADANKGP